jgi:diguanylate cyclase (GGDEF)-like protein
MKRAGAPYAVMMIDIDFFKNVNDSHGHAVGDEALALIAQELSANLRNYDFISRWGGEEFLVLLPSTGLEQALVVAEKLRAAVERIQHPVADRLTISIGVAVASANEPDEDAAVISADERLYDAKRGGRNRVMPVAGPQAD